MKLKAKWHQSCVIHCPNPKCNGMLLHSEYFHEMKCSKCGKYWLEISQFIETKKPEDEEQKESR